MIEKNMTLTNETGFHARPAGIFVKMASSFSSKIEIKAKGKAANGKSIMSLLSLGLEKGTPFTLAVDGTDEEAASTALEKLIQNHFQV